jgi:hypothetical protein
MAIPSTLLAVRASLLLKSLEPFVASDTPEQVSPGHQYSKRTQLQGTECGGEDYGQKAGCYQTKMGRHIGYHKPAMWRSEDQQERRQTGEFSNQFKPKD